MTETPRDAETNPPWYVAGMGIWKSDVDLPLWKAQAYARTAVAALREAGLEVVGAADLKRVRDLHRPGRYVANLAPACFPCGPYPWPCPTARAVYTADEIEELSHEFA